MNIVPFELPLQRRVAAKFAGLGTSELLTAAIDVIADIRPRRTAPQGFDVIVTLDKQVFVVRIDADDEVRADLLGTFDEFRHKLKTLGHEAECTERELRWLYERINDCVLEESAAVGKDQGDKGGRKEQRASASASAFPSRRRLVVVK